MASVGSDSEEGLSLNIMPMLDVFSILILFLLMSFSTDPVSHDITSGLVVPESLTIRSLDEIPVITASKSELRVADQKVASIDPATSDFTQEDRRGGQGALLGLHQELTKIAEANKKRKRAKVEQEEDDPDLPPDSLTMEIDKEHHFVILRRIMKSAQQAEFVAFKLMVTKNSE